MHHQIERALNEIDAALHSSDLLSDKTERERLKGIIRTWALVIEEWEAMPDEPEDAEPETK